MSKRAEELASVLFRMAMLETSHDLRVRIGMDELLSKASALIDAELRKERERCAERATKAYDGSGRLRNFKAMQAAILSEESFPQADKAGVCTKCGGFVYHRKGKPGEYDHDCSHAPTAEKAEGEAKALSESCEALIKKWDSEMGREDWAPNFAEELREALTREAPKDESAEENN